MTNSKDGREYKISEGIRSKEHSSPYLRDWEKDNLFGSLFCTVVILNFLRQPQNHTDPHRFHQFLLSYAEHELLLIREDLAKLQEEWARSISLPDYPRSTVPQVERW